MSRQSVAVNPDYSKEQISAVVADNLVSVIIPVGPEEDRLDLLIKAISSVKSQTYRPIEIIVIQDGPGSSVESALNDSIQCSQIELIKASERLGPSGARNLGVGNAQGSIIAFLDSDDEWLPEKLAKQVQQLTSDEIGVVGCDAYSRNVITGDKRRKYVRPMCGKVFHELLTTSDGIQTSMLLIRRSCFDEVGGFREGMSFGEEKDLQLRVAKKHKFAWVDEPLGIQNYHPLLNNLSYNIKNAANGINQFYLIWKDTAARELGDKGIRLLRRWLYGYLANARIRQFEKTTSIFERVACYIEMLRTGEIFKMTLMTQIKFLSLLIFGSSLIRCWAVLKRVLFK